MHLHFRTCVCGMFKNPNIARFTTYMLPISNHPLNRWRKWVSFPPWLRLKSINLMISAGVPNARQETEIWDKSSQKNPKSFLQWDVLLQTGESFSSIFQHWLKLFLCLQVPYSETFDKTLVFSCFDYDRFSKHDQVRWYRQNIFHDNIFENIKGRLITKKYSSLMFGNEVERESANFT